MPNRRQQRVGGGLKQWSDMIRCIIYALTAYQAMNATATWQEAGKLNQGKAKVMRENSKF